MWFRKRTLFRRDFQFLRHKMIGIPELPSPRIGNAGQRAATRRSPVGGEYRLPNHENVELLLAVLGNEPLYCGGPPQAYRSSRRDEQDQAG